MNEFRPPVSIVIPVYNGANFLRQAIESALAQDYAPLEIVVVNDGSTDGGKTREVAKSFGERIRYFEKPNGGVATALNLGIKEMTGQYFSWLSHDDMYEESKISKQVQLLGAVAEPLNTVVYCDWKTIDKDGYPVARTGFAGVYPAEKLERPIFALVTGLLHGCALLVPKRLLEAVDGFDPKLRTTQDMDCWHKIFKIAQVACVPEMLVRSRIHPEQDSKKITSHSSESDHLWLRIFRSLSVEDMIFIAGSERSYLLGAAQFFKRGQFNQAHLVALQRLGRLPELPRLGVRIKSCANLADLESSLRSLHESAAEMARVFIVDGEKFEAELRRQFATLPLVFIGAKATERLLQSGVEFLFFMNGGSVFSPGKIAEQSAAANLAGADWCLSSTILNYPDGTHDFWSAHPDAALNMVMAGLMLRVSAPGFAEALHSEADLRGFLAARPGICLYRPLAEIFAARTFEAPRSERQMYRQVRSRVSWIYKRSGLIYLREWSRNRAGV